MAIFIAIILLSIGTANAATTQEVVKASDVEKVVALILSDETKGFIYKKPSNKFLETQAVFLAQGKRYTLTISELEGDRYNLHIEFRPNGTHKDEYLKELLDYEADSKLDFAISWSPYPLDQLRYDTSFDDTKHKKFWQKQYATIIQAALKTLKHPTINP